MSFEYPEGTGGWSFNDWRNLVMRSQESTEFSLLSEKGNFKIQ